MAIRLNEDKMTNNRITDGVGKKIVEALKMQTEVEVAPVSEVETDDFEFIEEVNTEDQVEPEVMNFEEEDIVEDEITPEPVFTQPVFTEPVFTEPVTPQININIQPQQSFMSSDLDGFEIPANVAVLKQLITKLPTGVTKQTGALIIKQTMEALGISMKSVLQEAQQVQENLNTSSRNCQASIMEYKKQIGILEQQAQKYQRQYAALNDIISLFVQTNI